MQYKPAVHTSARSLLIYATLCAIPLIAYTSAFRGDFHYDDSLTVVGNVHLASWRTFVGHLDHMVRPVLYATFLLDRWLHGPDPAGYHLINVFLHLGSGLLLYHFLTRALPGDRTAIPFWTALFFLAHPIATETVTYISGRASGLMSFFYLLALFLYVEALRQPAGRGRAYLAGAVASFALSIGSKETAVTLPVVLLLWDWLIGGKRGSDLRGTLLRNHLPFWIVLLSAAAWAFGHPRYMALAQFSLTIRPFRDHLLSELHATAYALLLMFTPWKQSFDHDLPEFHSLFQWPLPLDLLLILSLAALAIYSVRRYPLVAFGVTWFLIQILPISVIPRNDLLSERNLYLPSIGLLLAIVTTGPIIARRLMPALPRSPVVRFSTVGITASLALSLCLFTVQRNDLYRDRLLLWSDAVKKSPNKARPHNNLGHAYALRGDWDRAIDEFRTAARLDPDFILAQQNLRNTYLQHRVPVPQQP